MQKIPIFVHIVAGLKRSGSSQKVDTSIESEKNRYLSDAFVFFKATTTVPLWA